ncbi:MAG TPA: hypothetical protein VGM90_09200 [Kofleriaceae bacterium]|jgi:hypothetical protein
MRRFVLASVALTGLSIFATTGCGGPQVPKHNGYKSEKAKPWKNAKRLTFDEKGTTKAEGDLSYPEMRRAKWYELDLPTPGELTIKLDISPPGDAVNEDFDLAMEVLDPGNRVISKADLEEEDAGEQTKTRTLYDLQPGHYLLHLYLQSRLDTGDYTVKISFTGKGSAGEVKSDFPTQVAFIPPLPMVPLNDDTPKGYQAPKATVVTIKKGPRKTVAVKEEPKAESKTARIMNIAVAGSSTVITIGIGTDAGVSPSWKGKIAGVPGSFSPSACNARTCTATVSATPDQIKAGGASVSLTP